MSTCVHCRKAEADPQSMGWIGWLPLLLGMPPYATSRHCKDCAAGLSIPWLLLLAGLAVAGFVVTVILLG